MDIPAYEYGMKYGFMEYRYTHHLLSVMHMQVIWASNRRLNLVFNQWYLQDNHLNIHVIWPVLVWCPFIRMYQSFLGTKFPFLNSHLIEMPVALVKPLSWPSPIIFPVNPSMYIYIYIYIYVHIYIYIYIERER